MRQTCKLGKQLALVNARHGSPATGRSRLLCRAAILVLALAAAGCARPRRVTPPAAPESARALCMGTGGTVRVTLRVDSVRPGNDDPWIASVRSRVLQLRGTTAESATACVSGSGALAYHYLAPYALSTGLDATGAALWQVDGGVIVVDFRVPDAPHPPLVIALPLDGRTGCWVSTAPGGTRLGGRAVVGEGEPDEGVGPRRMELAPPRALLLRERERPMAALECARSAR